MKKQIAALLLGALLLAGCGKEAKPVKEVSFVKITPQEAKTMMEEQPEAVVLDVREESEYLQGHVPGAVLLPVGTITAETAAKAIPAQDTTVLVYCRSGNRSKTASKALAELGYSAVYEFGGIMSWPYEVEK